MPRHCSVFGCRSNYDKELEHTTTFSLPKNDMLRRLWLRKIPTDLQHLKNPVICIKHFEENSIIRTDSVTVNKELKTYPRQRVKLKDNAVPTIFQNVPSYLTPPEKTRRRIIDVEKENMSKDNTTSQSQINASSLKSTILDHPYPIMTLAKTVQNINKSSCQQSEQHTEHPASIEDPTNLTCVEILSETGNQMDSENAESTSKADQKTPMSEGEINLLMKQQEQLIKQQGQMLQVLQELKDIQKEILGLKRKNHELKLTKLRIAAQQAGIKVITKANK